MTSRPLQPSSSSHGYLKSFAPSAVLSTVTDFWNAMPPPSFGVGMTKNSVFVPAGSPPMRTLSSFFGMSKVTSFVGGSSVRGICSAHFAKSAAFAGVAFPIGSVRASSAEPGTQISLQTCHSNFAPMVAVASGVFSGGVTFTVNITSCS